MVVAQVNIHYQKAGIPTKFETKMAEDIEKLYSHFISTLKSKTDAMKENFKKKLHETMSFWTKRAVQNMEASLKSTRVNDIDKIRIKEDLKFLENMMSSRTAVYASADVEYAMVKKRRRMRAESQTSKRHQETPSIEHNVEEEVEMQVEDSKDDNWVPPATSSHRRTSKAGTTITLSPQFLMCPLIVAAAIRNKILSVALSNIMHALIQSCGGEPDKVNLSYAQVSRYLGETVDQIADNITSKWTPPTHLVLHWDGKLIMETLDGYKKEERLPVLVSGSGVTKLLGVPALTKQPKQKAGEIISESTVSLLEEWNCKQNVKGMVFDTTASNTGHKTAGCVSV